MVRIGHFGPKSQFRSKSIEASRIETIDSDVCGLMAPTILKFWSYNIMLVTFSMLIIGDQHFKVITNINRRQHRCRNKDLTTALVFQFKISSNIKDRLDLSIIA